jgi:hypothetical protein
MATVATHPVNRVYLQHDLMVELGRIEMEVESEVERAGGNRTAVEARIHQLEDRLQKIRVALSRLHA